MREVAALVSLVLVGHWPRLHAGGEAVSVSLGNGTRPEALRIVLTGDCTQVSGCETVCVPQGRDPTSRARW